MQTKMIETPADRNDGKEVIFRRILSPTDLTADGKKAVEYAIVLAEHFGAQLTLLYVYQVPGANDYARMLQNYNVAELAHEKAQNALDSFCARIRKKYPRMDTALRCGVPAEEIAAVAKDLEVDLIVISTHNYHWFTHLISGSDAEQVLRRAPCPILIVQANSKGGACEKIQIEWQTRKERSAENRLLIA